uniref:Aldose 1-epimerase n=1 Tax=Solanum tuberosum TaxID=4113 RepID=M1AD68_SOLTU
MEVSLRSDVAVFGRMVVGSVLEAVVAETLLAAQRSVASLLIVLFEQFLCQISLILASRVVKAGKFTVLH